MKKPSDIEDLFKEGFKEFKAEPSHSLWKTIRRKLIISDFLSFQWKTINIYFISVIILIALPVFYYSFKPKLASSVKLENTKESFPINDTIAQSIPIFPISNDTACNDQKNQSEIKKSVLINTETSTRNKMSMEVISKSPSQTVLREQGKNFNNLPEENQKEYIAKIQALFIPSAYSGCKPLRVKFRNLSTNGQEFLWDFGDGESSDIAQPEHTFNEGGRFLVSLTIKGEDMQIRRYSETIEVYDSPIVSFEPDFDSNLEYLEIFFYNYTTGADRFSWDFGDGTFSERKEPMHNYKNQGTYNVLLRAWSAEGCMDSLTIQCPFSGEDPEITFPTAFAPNLDGPTGGYFIPGERNNMVFHPYTPDVPVEYQLKIFNRKGNLIFESNDFQTGWDGYYMQQLQPHGVYVYKVKGKYSSGKPFMKMGDVTLIRNRRY